MQPSSSERSPRGSRPERLAVLPALLAGLALLAAGCGGGSPATSVASLGTTTTSTTTRAASSQNGGQTGSSRSASPTAFSACMRSHGLPGFPDPDSNGGVRISPANGVNPNSPQFKSAQRACQKLMPRGASPSPTQQAQMQAEMLKYSACMRSHGLPDFPDPQFSGGQAMLKVSGNSINPRSPQFKAAQTACEKLLPGRAGGAKGGLSTFSGPAPSDAGGAKP